MFEEFKVMVSFGAAFLAAAWCVHRAGRADREIIASAFWVGVAVMGAVYVAFPLLLFGASVAVAGKALIHVWPVVLEEIAEFRRGMESAVIERREGELLPPEDEVDERTKFLRDLL